MIALYKCPNCGGSMVFSPETNSLICEYCKSSFTEEELTNLAAEYQKANEGVAEEESAAEKNNANASDIVMYTCPSCGAQIAVVGTEMVSTCYYCHNSVIRSDTENVVFNPECIIPFSVSKEKAKQFFMDWAKKKKFVPNDFFTDKQIEQLTGVYYPYWITDCKTNGRGKYNAYKVRSWRRDNTEFVETSTYEVNRAGSFSFPGITTKALSKIDSRIAESVQPFQLENSIPYSKAYLLGFQAECRDISQKEACSNLETNVVHFTESLMRDSVESYSRVVPIDTDVNIVSANWKYGLLPVWVITYKAKDGEIYSFSMNGQTGNTCGELPVSAKKVIVLSIEIFVPVFLAFSVLGCILEYIL